MGGIKKKTSRQTSISRLDTCNLFCFCFFLSDKNICVSVTCIKFLIMDPNHSDLGFGSISIKNGTFCLCFYHINYHLVLLLSPRGSGFHSVFMNFIMLFTF